MTSIDDKIKQAFKEEFNETIDENNKLDSSLIKQFSLGFKGKMKKSYRLAYLYITVFYCFIGLSAYKFYFAQDMKTQLMYVACGLFFSMCALLGELWYFSEMGRNRVIREIKVVELQLAQVLKNQEMD